MSAIDPNLVIAKRPILLDGAMGTNLIKAGMPQGVCPESWILDNIEIVEKLQYDYIMAGSDIIYAPTFGANRAVLSRFGLEDKVGDYNRRLVAISKNAVARSGKNVLIAADLSPTGLFMVPFGETTFEEIEDIYREQALAAYEAGVDMFVIETTISLCEAKAALSAVRSIAPSKPVFVTVTVDSHFKTMSGNSLEACFVSLWAAGASAFGVNCSQGPEDMLEALKGLLDLSKAVGIPLIAKPNVGMPYEIDGRQVFDLSAEDFATQAKLFIENGIEIIGGCCGSDPSFIAALSSITDNISITSPQTEIIDINRIVCNDKESLYIDEDITIPDSIRCDIDLQDNIMEAQDDGAEMIRVWIEHEDECINLMEASYLINLPLMLGSNSYKAIEKAIKQYAGRVILDLECSLTGDEITQLINNYHPLIL